MTATETQSVPIKEPSLTNFDVGEQSSRTVFASRANKEAAAAIRFIESLKVSHGRKAGSRLKLLQFQREFVKNALRRDVLYAILSIARGNGKTPLCSAIALFELIHGITKQNQREIILAAKVRDQSKVAFNYCVGFCESLPDEIRSKLIYRRGPTLEIEYKGNGGPHILRAIAASGANILGASPTLCLLDEVSAWPLDQGQQLESALLSGLGKRDGKAFLLSTSASWDGAPFSKWIDEPKEHQFTMEFRPPPNLEPDDPVSLIYANPACQHGIGNSLAWLQSEARRCISAGGSTLSRFRNLNRNERVAAEGMQLLLTPDQWKKCEVGELPAREGSLVVGVDLGICSSMSAASFYWPSTGRLEAFGVFPQQPSLAERGLLDSVGDSYLYMKNRGELFTIGDQVINLPQLMEMVGSFANPYPIAVIVSNESRKTEMQDACRAAGLNCPLLFRSGSYRENSEDVERLRRAVFERKVYSKESLLLARAFGDAVTLQDEEGNQKLAKARSQGRVDSVAATILAVAEGQRRLALPVKKARVGWAW